MHETFDEMARRLAEYVKQDIASLRQRAVDLERELEARDSVILSLHDTCERHERAAAAPARRPRGVWLGDRPWYAVQRLRRALRAQRNADRARRRELERAVSDLERARDQAELRYQDARVAAQRAEEKLWEILEKE